MVTDADSRRVGTDAMADVIGKDVVGGSGSDFANPRPWEGFREGTGAECDWRRRQGISGRAGVEGKTGHGSG